MPSEPGGSQERARAARILVDVLHRQKTTDQSIGSDASPLLQELVYGTLRYFFILEPAVTGHLQHELRSKDLDLRCLLLVGAYQLHYTRIPSYAAINETVNACRALRKPWARGLVNAVLRKVAKTKPNERLFGLPEWIAELMNASYPDQVDALMEATLERAPMSLRINTNRIDPQGYAKLLADVGIEGRPGWLPENTILTTPRPSRSLPGYQEGLISVQDAGAMFAAPLLLDPAPAGRILDACAAPGGKLYHLAEQTTGAAIVGLEQSTARLAHLTEEAGRLGHHRVEIRQGDATDTRWHDGAPFDAVLLDAPCSGSGTLRRHPDIKILRQPADLSRYVDLQRALLENLWRLLSPGGTFLYCTCSIFPEENDAVVDAFRSAHTDAQLLPFTLPLGTSTRHGWQLLTLPGADAPHRTVDGFYFARMTRSEEAR